VVVALKGRLARLVRVERVVLERGGQLLGVGRPRAGDALHQRRRADVAEVVPPGDRAVDRLLQTGGELAGFVAARRAPGYRERRPHDRVERDGLVVEVLQIDPGELYRLAQAEVDELLARVGGVEAAVRQHQHVGIAVACLGQVRREVAGAQLDDVVPDLGAARACQDRRQLGIGVFAERVVGLNEVPLLA